MGPYLLSLEFQAKELLNIRPRKLSLEYQAKEL